MRSASSFLHHGRCEDYDPVGKGSRANADIWNAFHGTPPSGYSDGEAAKLS